VLSTTEEVTIDAKKAMMNQLYSTGLAVYHASFDKAVMEEKDLKRPSPWLTAL
jgi:hypothetical protein